MVVLLGGVSTRIGDALLVGALSALSAFGGIVSIS